MALQRMIRGYSDEQIWELDSHLSTFMCKALDQMRENGIGHPVNMSSGEWKKILVKIKQGFEAAQAIENMDYIITVKPKNRKAYRRVDKGRHDKLHHQFREGMGLLTEYYFALWY